MKTQVNHQTGALKYTTLVLAGSLLLVVFLTQINNSKTNNPGNYTVHSVATESASYTLATTTEVAEVAEKAVPSVLPSNEVVLVKETATATVIEENVEAEVSLADWMVDGNSWNTNHESEVILSAWMLSTDPWTVNNDTQQELVLLEDWMLDTVAWNLINNSMFADERVEEVNLEAWMLTVEPWMDYNKPEQLHNIESLLTFFSEK